MKWSENRRHFLKFKTLFSLKYDLHYFVDIYKGKVQKRKRKNLQMLVLPLVKLTYFPFFLPYVAKCVAILSMLGGKKKKKNLHFTIFGLHIHAWNNICNLFFLSFLWTFPWVEFYIFKIASTLWHPLKFISSSQWISYTIYCCQFCLCPFCAAKSRMILQSILYLWKLIFSCYIILTKNKG